jgi:hypothetical protein
MNTSDILTAAEINHIQTGYKHMVDGGYGKLNTAADVLKVLAVHIEYAKREILIGQRSGFDCTVQIAMLEANELTLKDLSGRVGV